MKFRIFSVGREKADPAAPLVRDYLARIEKMMPVDDTVLKPGAEDRLIARLRAERSSGYVAIALDERGKTFTSAGFASLVESWMTAGRTGAAFFIGAAEGLSPGFIKEADMTLSLSSMTLPHRLARLLLAEQLYRALCILRHIPYHK